MLLERYFGTVHNPDRVVSHNLMLALFLTPNAEPRVKPMNDIIRDYVFSAMVVYKLTVQSMCSLHSTVNKLGKYARKKTPAIAVVSLLEAAASIIFPIPYHRRPYQLCHCSCRQWHDSGHRVNLQVPSRLSALSH